MFIDDICLRHNINIRQQSY